MNYGVDLGLVRYFRERCMCVCTHVCVCAGACSISEGTGVETSSYGIICPRAHTIFPRFAACTMGGKH